MTDETTRVMSDAELEATERLAEARLADARSRPVDPKIAARVEAYLARPYRMEVRGSPGEGYLASAPELPGCVTAGETPEAALAALRDAMATWLEAAAVASDPIPEPSEIPEGRFTGRMLLRMPTALHRALAQQAAREDVSVNQLATTLIAAGLERQREQFLADVEKALDTTGVQPGPELEYRRFLREMIRVLAHGGTWDPANDTPGSPWTALANAYLRLVGALPPEALDEMKRRVAALEPNAATRNKTPGRASGARRAENSPGKRG
jgi:predicted RNase H-like HicB family nuclease